MKKKTYINILLIVSVLFGGLLNAQSYISSPDSLKKVSVDELLQLRRQLLDRQNNLKELEQKLRGKGVGLSRDFLKITRADNENQDKILIRIAEYYIENADEAYDARMEDYYKQLEEYDKLYARYERGEIGTEPKEPAMPLLDYSDALKVYDVLVENFPESELADDALYNKAFLLNKMKRGAEARMVYQEIIDKYPDSQFVVEAYMQLAEYYFMPREDKKDDQNIIELEKAIRLYTKVLDFKDTKRFDEALYKLGWSYYRLAAVNPDYFNDAIVYFTAVVKDIEKAKSLDPKEKISNLDLEPEALEYIGICFADETYPKRGIDNCKAYVEKLGKPSFGVEIIRNLGNTYAKIERLADAIQSYETLLDMYPEYKYAPHVRKDIADIYFKMDDQESAFDANEKLFANYNPKSEWYANYEKSDEENKFDILESAYRFSEEALRTNIVYLLDKAQELEANGQPAETYYADIISKAQNYLEIYPTDKNAYGVNWSLALILDTKMNRYAEAYEEYIKVSNDYLEEEYRELAANNAIVVADTLVRAAKKETMVEDTVRIEGEENAVQVKTELLDEEKRLAEAYDNYIKLFPTGEKTPDILVAAGGLYYEHRQFDKAKVYYKTLVTRFPEAKEKNMALYSMMNTYFQLGQYVDAEFMARKILTMENISDEKKEIAKKRIAESIYKNAEKLEQEEKYAEAGYEYLRVFRDASEDTRFVDLSLLKAGAAFDKAEQYNKAIEAYYLLADNFPKSKYAIPSLEAAAQDYKILEDYGKVAATFEDIFNRYPESKQAEVALYNSSYYFAQAEDWKNAIRINNLYVNKFPESTDARDLYFENARLYLKIDDLDNANLIYKDFAARFPDDPRVVEAYYQRGKYYLDKDQLDLAKQEFNFAVKKSESFKRSGKDPNAPIAAEAMYNLAEILFKEFEAVEFRYPESQVKQSIAKKRKLLGELESLYKKIVAYGSVRSFEAMYKIAYLYESLANSISSPIFPQNMSLEKKIGAKTKMLSSSINIFEKALEEYKKVTQTIPKLAERMDISLSGEETQVEEPLMDDSIQVLQKQKLVDSTREVALKWLQRSQNKISEILYVMAERNASITNDIVTAPNPYPPLSWESVLYQEQLIKVIVPKIGITIKAHLRNVNESRELGLENKYMLESQRKLLMASNLIGLIYENALTSTFKQYERLEKKFNELVAAGDNATDETGRTYYDYYDNILNILDYFNSFGLASLKGYANSLKLAQANNIVNDVSKTTEEHIMFLASSASNQIQNYADSARMHSEHYKILFDSNQTAIYYQDGTIFYSDFAASLNQYNQSVLEEAFALHETYNIDNYWYKTILAKLIKIDPNKYLANIPKEKVIIESDGSWLCSTTYDPGYAYNDFDDSRWVKAKEVEINPGRIFKMFDSLGVYPPSIWIYSTTAMPDTAATDTLLGANADSATVATAHDSLGVADSLVPAPVNYAEMDTGKTQTVYFRKRFTLKSTPISGYLMATADQDFRLYLNEEYILDDFDDNFEIVEKLSLADLQEFIKTGDNLIAIDVVDKNGKPREGLRFYLYLELMPSEIDKTLAEMQKIQEEKIEKKILKKITILNKNKIVQ